MGAVEDGGIAVVQLISAISFVVSRRPLACLSFGGSQILGTKSAPVRVARAGARTGLSRAIMCPKMQFGELACYGERQVDHPLFIVCIHCSYYCR